MWKAVDNARVAADAFVRRRSEATHAAFESLNDSRLHAPRQKLARAVTNASGVTFMHEVVDFNHPWQSAMHHSQTRANPMNWQQILLTLALNL